MVYDFTSVLDRRGRDALAVDKPAEQGFFGVQPQPGFSLIPMWVADMNFATVPAVPQALAQRAAHPAYGYFAPAAAYTQAIVRWQARRNGVTGLAPADIGYENGVLGGVVAALKAVCAPGDRVLLQSPTYIGFSHCLADNGWQPVLDPLRPDEDGVWRIDYAGLEARLAAQPIHAAIFCSPHNPCGRVWTAEEIARLMALYQKYDVTVISDEIWSDLTLPGYAHVPTQSVSADARRRTVALYAPSKTFNLAGLVGSYHIIYDPALRDRIAHISASTHYNSMNVLSMHALIAAYSDEGADWLDQLRGVLADNLRYAVDFIRSRFAGVSVTMPQGTYMLFLDCTQWCAAHGKTLDELLQAGVKVGVIWQDGRPFYGACHIRMNLALPHSLVQQAFDRLDRLVFNA